MVFGVLFKKKKKLKIMEKLQLVMPASVCHNHFLLTGRGERPGRGPSKCHQKVFVCCLRTWKTCPCTRASKCLPLLLSALIACTSSTISENPAGVVVEVVNGAELANEKQGLLLKYLRG